MTQGSPSHQPANPAAMWTALVLAVVVAVGSPMIVWAQGAGCGGTAIQFTSLDNLLRTAWEYLTSGAVIRIMAAPATSSPTPVFSPAWSK